MGSDHRHILKSRFNCNAGNVFFFVSFGLAIFNIWYASQAIKLGGNGNGERKPSWTMTMTSSSGINNQTANAPKLLHPNIVDNSNAYNFTVGICAIVKDGEAYMTEWIDYHLAAVGIDKIYIYDNSGEGDLRRWHRNTRSHPLYHRVEIVDFNPGYSGRQKRAYTDCIHRFGRNVNKLGTEYARREGLWNVTDRVLDKDEGMDYLALIDIDEFLVPRGGYASVHGVIDDYLAPYHGGSLTVNWMLFGSSNKTVYAPIPVTKRFRYRDEMASSVVKTIVRASDFYSVSTPHSVNTVYGGRRTTSFKGAILHTNISHSGASDPDLPSEVLLLHHYRYTSHKEYYHKKCVRMETDGMKGCSFKTGKVISLEELQERGMPTHIAMRTGTVYDDSAWKLLTERVPKYRMYDDESAWGDYT